MILKGHDTSKKVFVIAEIGVNHEGDFKIARELVMKAASAGAGAVKFQTYMAEEYVSISDKERFLRAKRFQLDHSEFRSLANLAHKKGLLFISTPLDFESVDELETFIDAYKIASCDFTNLVFIDYVLSKQKPVIISSGMASIREMDRTMNFIKSRVGAKFYKEKIALLHCISSYPAPLEEVNLRSMPFLRERYGITVGYSDHTKGIFTVQLAVCAGARLIEKHFTYRKENQAFRDHALSADPNDMKEMVNKIRLIEKMLGSYGKKIASSEKGSILSMRRGLGARNDIKKGMTIKRSDITFLRPCLGLGAELYARVVGRKASRDLKKGELIKDKDIA